jgi:hypothetical protein
LVSADCHAFESSSRVMTHTIRGKLPALCKDARWCCAVRPSGLEVRTNAGNLVCGGRSPPRSGGRDARIKPHLVSLSVVCSEQSARPTGKIGRAS